VGAFNEEKGVVSVGGVGFDISCGVRTMKTDLMKEDILKKQEELAQVLFEIVPAGLGVGGDIRLTKDEVDEVLTQGAEWPVKQGYGIKDDLEYIEENGRIPEADSQYVSDKAKKRQKNQLGSLGSGNHYLEVQFIEEIYDEKIAKMLGLVKDSIVVSIHCGSRGLGHQVATDYLKTLAESSRKYDIPIRDREMVCAPINSEEGQNYLKASFAATNIGLANREVIGHLTRQCFNKVFGDTKIKMLYDVSHNTCKIEEHKVDGKKKKLYVHRKGATRAFGPGMRDLPKEFLKAGQPVLIGGSMGTSSFILVGCETGEKAFYSACHGAGRRMSRTQAKRTWFGEKVVKDLRAKGIVVKSHSYAGIAEEAPDAYKDVVEVVDSIVSAGLAKKVAMVKPLVNIKG